MRCVTRRTFVGGLKRFAGYARPTIQRNYSSKISQEQVIAVMGAQWGDEGKGKLVDVLGSEYDIIARCAGGSNAGHTVIVEGRKYAFHLMPSGILHKRATCLIGNGVVLHIPTLFKELESLDKQDINYEGRIKLSERAHIVFDFHQEVDALEEDSAKAGEAIGTTKRGIGPAYMSKIGRKGIRVGDLRHPDAFKAKLTNLVNYWKRAYPSINVDIDAEVATYLEYFKRIKPMVVDSVTYVNKAYDEGKKIMIEGANATMLDIDFGTYPFVTSSNCSIGGAMTGLGLAPSKLDAVVGIMKAYTTRVGAGPFPTELEGELGEKIRAVGGEYGTTTGRPRRCGWLDGVAMKHANMINNFTCVNMTKLDVLSELDEVKLAVAYSYKGQTLDGFPSSLEDLANVDVEYETFPGWKKDISECRVIEDLPEEARAFIKRTEEVISSPVTWVGVGPGREALAMPKSV
eukprot:TRINITY_DN930_c0_g1_i2.p2 TRINITY_DN930_c0_g1~~TRINITY_DN930_c0_g1_i2.p2  ORF type:complete len:459 (+),score=76.49 TRINITY_DN930_c0_g1_i2:53-1429(+)